MRLEDRGSRTRIDCDDAGLHNACHEWFAGPGAEGVGKQADDPIHDMAGLDLAIAEYVVPLWNVLDWMTGESGDV